MTSVRNLLVLLAALIHLSAHAELRLACQDSIAESTLLSHLPKGLIVRSEHLLQINLPTGIVRLADQPPFDQMFGGDSYEFCDRQGGYILVRLRRDDLFSGVLVRETDGAVIPAGLDAHFSPDEQAYFSEEQPDGLEGTLWKIFHKSGRLSWSGRSYIPSPNDPHQKVIELQSPKWNSKGEFTATASCVSSMDEQWQAKLTRSKGSSDWHWTPTRRCK